MQLVSSASSPVRPLPGTHILTCTRSHIDTCTHTYTDTLHLHTHAHIHTPSHIHTCAYRCMHIHSFTHVHTYTLAHPSIHAAYFHMCTTFTQCTQSHTYTQTQEREAIPLHELTPPLSPQTPPSVREKDILCYNLLFCSL